MRRFGAILAVVLMLAPLPAQSAGTPVGCASRRSPGPYASACRFDLAGRRVYFGGNVDAAIGDAFVIVEIQIADTGQSVGICSGERPFISGVGHIPTAACVGSQSPNVPLGTEMICRSRGAPGNFFCVSL